MKFYNDFNAMFNAQSGVKKDMSVFNGTKEIMEGMIEAASDIRTAIRHAEKQGMDEDIIGDFWYLYNRAIEYGDRLIPGGATNENDNLVEYAEHILEVCQDRCDSIRKKQDVADQLDNMRRTSDERYGDELFTLILTVEDAMDLEVLPGWD